MENWSSRKHKFAEWQIKRLEFYESFCEIGISSDFRRCVCHVDHCADDDVSQAGSVLVNGAPIVKSISPKDGQAPTLPMSEKRRTSEVLMMADRHANAQDIFTGEPLAGDALELWDSHKGSRAITERIWGQ